MAVKRDSTAAPCAGGFRGRWCSRAGGVPLFHVSALPPSSSLPRLFSSACTRSGPPPPFPHLICLLQPGYHGCCAQQTLIFIFFMLLQGRLPPVISSQTHILSPTFLSSKLFCPFFHSPPSFLSSSLFCSFLDYR